MTRRTRAALVAAAVHRLRKAGIEAPERDARLLLRWASGLEPAAFSARLDEPAGEDEADRFEAALQGRAARVPVSQITGGREFWGRIFRVTSDVLDPRPETECLVARALAGPPARCVLDLGTGSGCVLLTLLAEWPESCGVGTDISAAALAVAEANAHVLGVADRVEFRASDWCAGLSGRFDLVVSNPPYVAASELERLAPEVRLHEPRQALTLPDDPGDGLEAYRRIARGLAGTLAPGGRVLLEIGPTQAAAVADMIQCAGLQVTAILPDLDGRDRVVEAIEG